MARQMLSGILSIEDIPDVEAFAHKQARSYLRKMKIELGYHDYEDLISFILELIFVLYKEKWNKKESFAGYAAYIVSRRITDYFRQMWGRNGKKRAVLLSPTSPEFMATSNPKLEFITAERDSFFKRDSITDLTRVLSTRNS